MIKEIFYFKNIEILGWSNLSAFQLPLLTIVDKDLKLYMGSGQVEDFMHISHERKECPKWRKRELFALQWGVSIYSTQIQFDVFFFRRDCE